MQAKYIRVADALTDRIKSGEFKINELLPPIKQAAIEYSMSYVSIQKAYKLLESRGIVTTQNGLGSFVSPNALGRENLRTANLIFYHASTDLFAFEFLTSAILILKNHDIAANVIYLEVTSLSDLEAKVATADMNFVLTPATVLESDAVLKILRSNREKVVCFSNHPEVADLHTVLINDELAMNAAIDHLRSKGHERILFSSIEYTKDEYTWRSYDSRMRYWRAFVRSAYPGLPEEDRVFVTPSRKPEDIASELVDTLNGLDVTALICESTEFCKALRVLAYQGRLAIPDDVSVIMLGDTQLNVYGSPPFTAMSSDFKGLVRVGMEIIERGRSEADCETVIPDLMTRGSVKALARATSEKGGIMHESN